MCLTILFKQKLKHASGVTKNEQSRYQNDELHLGKMELRQVVIEKGV